MQVHYERYDAKFKDSHDSLIWDDAEEAILKFKHEHIYPNIVKGEIEGSMVTWLEKLSRHSFEPSDEVPETRSDEPTDANSDDEDNGDDDQDGDATDKRDEVTKGRDEVTGKSDEVTEKRDEVTEKRDEVTEKRDEVTDKDIDVTEKCDVEKIM